MSGLCHWHQHGCSLRPLCFWKLPFSDLYGKIIPVRSMQQYPHPSLHSCTPWKKGIRKPEATLGTALSDPAKTTSLCQEYEKELKSFAYSKLSEENRLTCDMLLLYFHTRASLGKTAPWMSRWDQAWVCRHNFPFFWRNILSGQKKISLIIWNFWVPSGHIFKVL